VSRLVRRNYGRGHGYKIDGAKVPGVTTVIDTLNKPALVSWAARTAAERAVNEWDALTALPLTERLARIQYGARDVTLAAALRGTQIHDLGDKLARGEDVDVPPEHVGPVEAYAKFMDTWGIEVIASETPLASLTHKYAGTTDLWCRVGARDNAVALLDIKTGKGVYDETGLQLAAYRHAEIMQPEPGVEIPVPPVDLVYVAHVLPDTVRMVPVVADERVFRTFLYLLAVFNERETWSEWPLVGSAEQP
jgi:hypothetical protein